ncbi:MAG: hypothetical protein J5897_03525 [Candidatus Methanomethylophilus sp.]|nr:hypothetical protein [Methanomethylophilus sp.]
MKVVQLLIVLVVAVVAVAGVGIYVTSNHGGNDNSHDSSKEVTEIVTNDPSRETAAGGGRLWILGNANMDDTLDEKDVEWIQKILDGKANEVVLDTKLSTWAVKARMADANNDGKISQADIDKVNSLRNSADSTTKQVLYYVDVDGAVNSMHYPAKTIVSTYEQNTKQLCTLNAMSKCIGVDEGSSKLAYTNEQFKDNFLISSSTRFDPEATTIMGANPDIIVTGTRQWYCNELEKALPAQRTNMDVVRISSWEDDNVLAGTLTLGFMIGSLEKAKEYVAWCDSILKTIEEKTSTLTGDQKVKVLVPRGQYDNWKVTFNGPRSGKFETSESAGAYNLIRENLTSTSTNVEVQESWVLGLGDKLDQIVSIVYGGFDNASFKGYTNKEYYDMTVDYYSALTSANGTQIHVLDNIVGQGTSYIVGVIYMAKWFYPTLFSEFNADALFQEYIDKFMPGFSFKVSEHSDVIAI